MAETLPTRPTDGPERCRWAGPSSVCPGGPRGGPGGGLLSLARLELQEELPGAEPERIQVGGAGGPAFPPPPRPLAPPPAQPVLRLRWGPPGSAPPGAPPLPKAELDLGLLERLGPALQALLGHAHRATDTPTERDTPPEEARWAWPLVRWAVPGAELRLHLPLTDLRPAPLRAPPPRLRPESLRVGLGGGQGVGGADGRGHGLRPPGGDVRGRGPGDPALPARRARARPGGRPQPAHAGGDAERDPPPHRGPPPTPFSARRSIYESHELVLPGTPEELGAFVGGALGGGPLEPAGDAAPSTPEPEPARAAAAPLQQTQRDDDDEDDEGRGGSPQDLGDPGEPRKRRARGLCRACANTRSLRLLHGPVPAEGAGAAPPPAAHLVPWEEPAPPPGTPPRPPRMMALAMGGTLSANGDTKELEVALALEGLMLKHRPDPPGTPWYQQLLSLLALEDEPVLGYTPPTPLTQLHLHLQRCGLDYRPPLPQRVLLAAETLSVTCGSGPDPRPGGLRLLVDDGSVFLSERCGEGLDLQRDFVSVLDVDFLELLLSPGGGGAGEGGAPPPWELLVAPARLRGRTCADSAAALARLLQHLGTPPRPPPGTGTGTPPHGPGETPGTRGDPRDRGGTGRPRSHQPAGPDGRAERERPPRDPPRDPPRAPPQRRGGGSARGGGASSGPAPAPGPAPGPAPEAEPEGFCVLEAPESPENVSVSPYPLAVPRVALGWHWGVCDPPYPLAVPGSPPGHPRPFRGPAGGAGPAAPPPGAAPPPLPPGAARPEPHLGPARGAGLRRRPRPPQAPPLQLRPRPPTVALPGGPWEGPGAADGAVPGQGVPAARVVPRRARGGFRGAPGGAAGPGRGPHVAPGAAGAGAGAARPPGGHRGTPVPEPAPAGGTAPAAAHAVAQGPAGPAPPAPPRGGPRVLPQGHPDPPAPAHRPGRADFPQGFRRRLPRPPEPPPGTPAREFRFTADVPVWLDYRGKRVTMEQGALAGILIGLARLNCSQLRLKRLCHRQGLLGLSRVVSYAVTEWLRDIRCHQLPGLLGGVAPVHAVLRLWRALRDLLLLPLQGGGPGGVTLGVTRGVTALGAAGASAALGLGARLLRALQALAEALFGLVAPPGPPRPRLPARSGPRPPGSRSGPAPTGGLGGARPRPQ
ncbi:basic proline-rich protein-like [Ammospiza caudacuta]|uniref:basic proline-rich protein-like n=1 Tax=Ammospiza caudacuta TaxID=2857398 RepID=UPI002738E2CF|nr:basic proline-rich protein-like [Ammospiza caudacuta]